MIHAKNRSRKKQSTYKIHLYFLAFINPNIGKFETQSTNFTDQMFFLTFKAVICFLWKIGLQIQQTESG